MGFYVYDANGYVGDAGTNTGWVSLCDYLVKSDNPVARNLAEFGWSEVGDIDDINPPSYSETVAATLANLKVMVKKCSDVVIISDGVE